MTGSAERSSRKRSANMADGEGDDPPLFREITALVEDNVIAHTSSRSPRARDGASNTHDLPTHDTMQDEQNSRTDLSLADLARNHQTQSQPQQPLDAASAGNVYLDGTEPYSHLTSRLWLCLSLIHISEPTRPY